MENYEPILTQFGFRATPRGPWLLIGNARGEAGWKLHVSSIQTQAERLLETIVPTLRDRRVPFKIARDATTLGLLNEGALGPTQVGKFMTVYPSTDGESESIGLELAKTTTDFDGPRVVTDLYVGGCVYSRFGPYNPKLSRDRLGSFSSSIQLSDETSIDTGYTVPFKVPSGLRSPFQNWPLVQDLVEPKSKLLGERYLLVDVLQVHAKGSVLLAIDLKNQETISLKVIKEGRRHCLSDAFGRAMPERLRRQQSISKALHDVVSTPRADDYFEAFGNGYLPFEFVKGHDLGHSAPLAFYEQTQRDRVQRVRELYNLASMVSTLHRANFVHRDLAPTNIRVDERGETWLIDLELAVHLDEEFIPFQRGTAGFMSPQQEAGAPPAFADDVYALGALMVLLFSGLDPRRVLFSGHVEQFIEVLLVSGTPTCLAKLAGRCLSPRVQDRPGADDVAKQLRASLEKVQGKGALIQGGPAAQCQEQRGRELVTASIHGLLHDVVFAEGSGLWSSVELSGNQHDAQSDVNFDFTLYRSANRGVAGVVYALARLARLGFTSTQVRPRVEMAIDWLLKHERTNDDQLPGLHFGEAGVALAISEAAAAGLVEEEEWLSEYLDEALVGPLDWPDITHGAAGQGIAALACADLLHRPALAEYSHRCARYLLESQQPEGHWQWPEGVPGMEGTVYTGFAHGVAGIVYFLAEYAHRFAASEAQAGALRAAEWLLSKAQPGSRFRSLQWPMRDGESEVWRWWCHGGPGIALSFLKLFEHFGDKRFADATRSALLEHPIHTRHSNLSQCHGLSGLGDIYIEAARVLHDQEWTARAEQITQLLFGLARMSTDGGATWLVEHPFRPTGDLMVGNGGVALYLARFLAPRGVSIPLLL